MPFHLLAYTESLGAAATLQDVNALADGIFTIQNNHFVPQFDYSLLYTQIWCTDIVRARLVSATFRQFAEPYQFPLSDGTVPTPGIEPVDYTSSPLTVRMLEELSLEVEHSNVGAQQATGLVAVARTLTPAPRGDVYTIRGTSGDTAGAAAWTQVTMTWDNTLPTGRYAAVGAVHLSATGQASRLIFEDQVERPGTPSYVTADVEIPTLGSKGRLGQWGLFDANRFPNVEVLCTAGDTAHVVYMDFVRIG